MKFLTITIINIFTVMISLTVFAASEHPQLKAFPDAEEGMERFVITLPNKKRGEEDNLKVELVPGKFMLTDGINIVRHSSSIESHPLKKWGYTFYEIVGRDVVISTNISVATGTKKIKRFVSGRPLMIFYNSRLPIVIYAPKGYSVQYRIWHAPGEFETVLKQDRKW